MIPEYDELRLSYWKVGAGRYLALANGPSAATAMITLPEPEQFIQSYHALLAEEFAQGAGITAGDGSSREDRLLDLGRNLFGILLPAPIRNCIRLNPSSARGGKAPRRLRLRFQMHADLAGLPLEILCGPADDPLQFLALQEQLTIVRSLRGVADRTDRHPQPDTKIEQPSICVIVACPDGYNVSTARSELAPLRERLKRVKTVGQVSYWIVIGDDTRATRLRIHEEIAKLPTAAVVFVIAHGERGTVLLENPDGTPDPVPADVFAALIAAGPAVRLVVLNLCRGSEVKLSEPFSGTAQCLTARGIPVVVGMQYEISEERAQFFTPLILERLLANTPVEEAINVVRREAKKTNQSHPKSASLEWSTPACFVSDSCGSTWLFKAPGLKNEADPLDGGKKIYDSISNGIHSKEQVLAAAYFAGIAAEYRNSRWEYLESLATLAKEQLDSTHPEIERLFAEAEIEKEAGEARRLCDALLEFNLPALRNESTLVRLRKRNDVWGALLQEIQTTAEMHVLYEQAGTAENAGDWKRAEISLVAMMTRFPSGFRDTALRYAYAQGRIAEDETRWEIAVAAYDLVTAGDSNFWPTHFKDVKRRKLYCGGRAGAVEADWSRAENSLVMVSDFQDAARWLDYARGRRAELRGDWQAAVKFFQRTDVEDARPRAAHLSGKQAVNENRWADAIACFEASLFEEAKDLLKYCHGRLAFAAGRWRDVIDGFGVLGDTYRDVGYYRRYARARGQEEESQWQLAAESHAGLGGFLDSPSRAHYCRGRLAADREQWEEAANAFAETGVSQEIPDVPPRAAYCRGRLAEKAEAWEAAVAAFAEAETIAPDVSWRGLYAGARAAEVRDEWKTAVELYSRISTGLITDLAARLTFARGRQAVDERRWNVATEEFRQLPPAERDATSWCQYAQALEAESLGKWSEASELLGRIPLTLCPNIAAKILYVRGRTLEAQGLWVRASETYQSLRGEDTDAAQRKSRIGTALQALPWLDGLAKAGLAVPPPTEGGTPSPYHVLAEIPLTPGSNQAEIKDATYVLMERGSMTPETRVAWDRMRTVPRRLQIDAQLIPVENSEALLQCQERLLALARFERSEALSFAVANCPQDAALFLLLSGDDEKALAWWDAEQAAVCANTRLAHSLAVATSETSRRLNQRGAYEEAERQWMRACSQWSVTLADEAYWSAWSRHRAACYGALVSENDLAVLRDSLRNQLLTELGGQAELPANSDATQLTDAVGRPALRFEIEFEAARTLASVGGLRVNAGGATISCGPLFLRMRSLEAAFVRLMHELEERAARRAARDDGDIVAALETALAKTDEADPAEVPPETLSRLRNLFSPLGEALLLLQHDSPALALRAIPTESLAKSLAALPRDCGHAVVGVTAPHHGCPTCEMYWRERPGYFAIPNRQARWLSDAAKLAIDSHLKLAEAALTKRDCALDEVLRHWTEALALGRRIGMQVRTKHVIARIAAGRAAALEETRGPQRGNALALAVRLLERARPIVGGVDDDGLRERHSDLLVSLGVWFGTGGDDGQAIDMAKAVENLRLALALLSTSVHACTHLSGALLDQATESQARGRADQAWQQIVEAWIVLADGLDRWPSHPNLLRRIPALLEELETMIISRGRADSAIERLEAALGRNNTGPHDPMRSGQQKLATGDLTGAALDFVDAVRLNSTDPSARRALSDSLQGDFTRVADVKPGA